jgi:hypothetical protein
MCRFEKCEGLAFTVLKLSKYFIVSKSTLYEAGNFFGHIATNVSICVRAGLPKPRGVPDTERIKDTKTLDYASTPLDANTLLCACWVYS